MDRTAIPERQPSKQANDLKRNKASAIATKTSAAPYARGILAGFRLEFTQWQGAIKVIEVTNDQNKEYTMNSVTAIAKGFPFLFRQICLVD
jgi:hypothetical protein